MLNTNQNLRLTYYRRIVWFISGAVTFICLLGLILSFLNPSIKAPLRPGLDFTGGTQIRLDRKCDNGCRSLSAKRIENSIKQIDFQSDNNKTSINLSSLRVQILDKGNSIVVRMPFLSSSQSNQVIDNISSLAGPFIVGSESIDTIGPSLGGQLLKSSLISLLVAFSGIALYITLRYDKIYAFLALVALAHDVLIVCGVFSWLGIIYNLEVDSLFAVALLTIAGYSVNDTVVVFDRIRERSRQEASLQFSDQIDLAVSATLTRTIYTSGTTLLPLIALICFGGSTLLWFSVALAIGVLVGSWSSIALAPSLLSLRKRKIVNKESDDEDLLE